MEPESDFQVELRDLINVHSMENGSNTPDYILADYLTMCLDAFNRAVNLRIVHTDGCGESVEEARDKIIQGG